jgi:sulfoxide reductase heme-binding subunit YedZ
VHSVVFAIFYAELQLQILLREVLERPYITLGMASLMILSLLSLTSTRGWQRRLGKSWKRLHQWVYLAVPLALLHLLWLRKDGYDDVAIYTLWAVVMAAERLYVWRKRQRQDQKAVL